MSKNAFKEIQVDRPVPVETWGRDHWSTFAYLECRVVDNGGIPEKAHMRCDLERHPAHGHILMPSDGEKYPTRLAEGVGLPDHDDWDCVDDMEASGLIKINGTGLFPAWELTDKGKAVAGRLRAHKADGGSFASFRPGSI